MYFVTFYHMQKMISNIQKFHSKWFYFVQNADAILAKEFLFDTYLRLNTSGEVLWFHQIE